MSLDRWVTTGKGKLFARVWAPLEPRRSDREAAVLLFHDSLGCVELWRDFPGQLAHATGRRVVAYDRLGFGRSDVHPGPLPSTFIRDEAAETVPALCEALGLESIVPLGHSVGGGMAITTASRWPELCAGVVTMSAHCFVEERTLVAVRAVQAGFARPGQIERLAKYHGAQARWVLDAWTGTWLGPVFANWHLDDELQAVRCPALIIHGDRDEYGSLEQPARMIRHIPSASRAAIFEGCGHFPHREQPERVLEEIARFVAEEGMS